MADIIPPPEGGGTSFSLIGSDALSIKIGKREMTMWGVFEGELDDLSDLGTGSMNFGFFGLMFGVFVTGLVTLTTVDLGIKMFSGYVGATVATGVLSFVFAIRSYRDYRKGKGKVATIKRDRKLIG